MKKPNFFIIGAPKCGTTSLARWLGEHPQIFMSTLKEPGFFNLESHFRGVETLQEYEALFEDALPEHIAVGEASTNYMWSKKAIPRILSYSSDSYFIAILRKPQEMVISLHAQECGGMEDQPDFETAWRLQPERAQGQKLPSFCRAPYLYQYGERCQIGSQLQRVLEHVPRERLLVLFLEDIQRNPGAEFDRVLQFLGVNSFRPKAFSRENSRRQVRSFLFKRVLNGLGYAKRVMGIRASTGLLSPFYQLNTTGGKTQELSQELQKELNDYFREEITLVEKLVGRIPKEWRN